MTDEHALPTPAYEPPTIEDLDTTEGPSVTAAGTTAGVTGPQPTAPPG